MFKKRVVKKKGAIRRRNREDDDEGEDDSSKSLHETIQQTQKKQKILSRLPVASGKVSNESKEPSAEDDVDGNGVPPTTSILESKHKSAMEEFIQSQLGGSSEVQEAKEPMKSSLSDQGVESSEEALYQQLAVEAAAAVNKPQHDSENQDGDVGTGGAMLVGGTGLTEVILPASMSRLNAAKPGTSTRVLNKNTSLSSAVAPASDNARHSSGGGGLLPAKMFGTFAPRQTTSSNNADRSKADTGVQSTLNDVGTRADDMGDSERTGFQARGGASSSASQSTTYRSGKQEGGKSRYQRNNDDRAFSQFVGRERGRGF